jgi:hypothetical protein
MKLFKNLFWIGVCLVFASPVVAENYVCELPATLEGTLMLEKSDPSTSSDEKSHSFPALRLKKAISVGCQTDDELCSPEQNVSVLQLALNGKQSEQFKKFKGSVAKVSGKLFHSDNGNHYTNVLIDVTSIAAKKVKE